MKTRRFVQLFLVMLCTVFFVCVNLILKTSKAYAWYYLPQEIIDNIYKESTGNFVTENLDALAATAGYSDINALLSAA
ncbi:MAG: hypothetical protein K2O81_03785, partial [Clostridia bacterium]|nr:hypothetical protein [Clostridia bacterium]